jgi:putative salt-induced outer membrane protein YdiY
MERQTFFRNETQGVASKHHMIRNSILFLLLLAGLPLAAQPILRTNIITIPPLLSGPSAFAPISGSTNKIWSGNIALGLTVTRGNARTLLATLGAHAVATWDHTNNELILDGNGAYGSSDGAETAESADGNAQYNRTLSQRFFAGLKLDAFHDGIADIRYRVTIAPLIGYYAIKSTNMLLGVEVGPGYIRERQDDEQQGYAILRLGERFEYKISKTARIWEDVEYMPQVNETDNYLVNFELGAEANLTKTVTLRAVLQDYFNNIPVPGFQRNDVRLVAGVGYKF